MKKVDQQKKGKEIEMSNWERNTEIIQLYKQADVTGKSITSIVNYKVINKRKNAKNLNLKY